MRVVGEGWTTVVALPSNSAVSGSPLFGMLAPVSGTWGSGRLLESKLVSVLVVDNGRTFVGAVDPSVLYAAAAKK
jgi:hypothetical protein